MSTSTTPHRDRIRIAAATGLGVTTVKRYFTGKPITAANLSAIERACVELDLPTRDELSAHELDPRTLEAK